MEHFIIIVDVEKTNGFIMVKAYVSMVLIAQTAESTDWTIIDQYRRKDAESSGRGLSAVLLLNLFGHLKKTGKPLSVHPIPAEM